jgi:general secretion pathway protein E
VRRLCPKCAAPSTPVADVIELAQRALPQRLAGQGANWREPVGCEACQGTGFSGRVGIHELVVVTPEMQHLIVKGGSSVEIWDLARKQGTRTLREDGFLKAWQGITSVEEVLRVTAS